MSQEQNKAEQQLAQLRQNLDAGDEDSCNFSTFFKPIEIIGQGAFGKVFQATDNNTGELLAVKVISKKKLSEEFVEKVKQEARFLQKMNHINVISFKGIYETETKVLIAMELMKGGSLAQLIKQRKENGVDLNEIEISLIMKSIIQGLAYIHSSNIVHRDLKPENILIGDPDDLSSIKIADFGLSQAFSLGTTNGLTQQCGTLLYMAPEFFVSRTYSKVICKLTTTSTITKKEIIQMSFFNSLSNLIWYKQIDIWSCGVIMHLLLDRGNHPFYDPKTDDSESFKAKLAAPKWRFPQKISEMALNLLQKMTLLNSTERYSAVQALQHPFITQSLSDSIPMTMNEQLRSIKIKYQLSQKIKAIIFINFLKLSNSLNQSLQINTLESPQLNALPSPNMNALNSQSINSEYYLVADSQRNKTEVEIDFTQIAEIRRHSSTSLQNSSKGLKIQNELKLATFKNTINNNSNNPAQNGNVLTLRKPPLSFLIKKAKGKQPITHQMHLNLTNTNEVMKSPGRANETGKDKNDDTFEKPFEKVANNKQLSQASVIYSTLQKKQEIIKTEDSQKQINTRPKTQMQASQGQLQSLAKRKTSQTENSRSNLMTKINKSPVNVERINSANNRQKNESITTLVAKKSRRKISINNKDESPSKKQSYPQNDSPKNNKQTDEERNQMETIDKGQYSNKKQQRQRVDQEESQKQFQGISAIPLPNKQRRSIILQQQLLQQQIFELENKPRMSLQFSGQTIPKQSRKGESSSLPREERKNYQIEPSQTGGNQQILKKATSKPQQIREKSTRNMHLDCQEPQQLKDGEPPKKAPIKGYLQDTKSRQNHLFSINFKI